MASIQIMRIFASEKFIIIMINFKEIPACPRCQFPKDENRETEVSGFRFFFCLVLK